MAKHSAVGGTPPGVDADAFAVACLADTYEVLADLVEVASGIVGGGAAVSGLLWPGAVQLAEAGGIADLVDQLGDRWDEVVLVPADVPDLPGLVLAKVFKALQHADVCVAPERGDLGGCVALGVRLPWPSWVEVELDLDSDPSPGLRQSSPRRSAVAAGPDWHRLRVPGAIHRLDPGLEGWENTRALLSGHRLAG